MSSCVSSPCRKPGELCCCPTGHQTPGTGAQRCCLAAQRISLPVSSAQSLIKKWNVSSKSWNSSSSQSSEQLEMTEEPGLTLVSRAVPVLQLSRVQLSILHAISRGLISLPKQKTSSPNFIPRYGGITWAFPKFSLVRIYNFFLSPCSVRGIPFY